MKAARIGRFGPPAAITIEDVATPAPGAAQLLVRTKAAGVGNWDALIRAGKVRLEPLPIILGAELSGVVSEVGSGISEFKAGDEVFGATNPQFSGAYAEYALAAAGMMALKPKALNFVQAASAPIVSVTAWQMLFDYARVESGQKVLILGASGNVGTYAAQLATGAGVQVEKIVDRSETFESLSGFDVVLDTVGGDAQRRSLRVLKPGGILVSAVSAVPEDIQKARGVRAAYFYVEVTTARLKRIAGLFESGKLSTHVGTVLPLEDARVAHEMLEGAPHKPGKIVLQTAG